MLVPGTQLHTMVLNGKFAPVTAQLELLGELEQLLANITVAGPVVFRTNHASNYLALKGTVPHDQERMLQSLRHAMHHPEALITVYSRSL